MKRLVFLGVGQVALATRTRLMAIPAAGSSRRPPDARFHALGHLDAADDEALRRSADGAHVVVSFPPSPEADSRFASLVEEAAAIVYLSSTIVYAPLAGHVDEATEPTPREASATRLAAEDTWRAAGASVVRLPALYGPSSGIHTRLAAGAYRMPAPGDGFLSRVHVDDAASFVVAALGAPPGSLLLAGDEAPAKHAEVVAFVCERFDFPTPEVEPPGAARHPSLQGDRRVDSSRTRARFGIELRYPTYREGYDAIARDLSAPRS